MKERLIAICQSSKLNKKKLIYQLLKFINSFPRSYSPLPFRHIIILCIYNPTNQPHKFSINSITHFPPISHILRICTESHAIIKLILLQVFLLNLNITFSVISSLGLTYIYFIYLYLCASIK